MYESKHCDLTAGCCEPQGLDLGRAVAPATSLGFDEPVWMSWAPGRWWVIHTRARNEKAVAAALERHDVRHYLPLVGVRHTYTKAKVTFHVPLFPGYLFLCGNVDERDVAWRTNRVANVLEVEDQEQLVAELTQVYRVVESGRNVALCPALRAGQRCRVTGGPLRDLEGVVIRHGRQWRMHLSVTMLGQSAVVEVDAAQLEAID